MKSPAKLHRFIILIVCFLLLLSSTAFAWVPVVIRVVSATIPSKYFIRSAIIHGGAVAAAILTERYIMKSDPATASKDGSIKHPSEVAWVDLQDVPNLPHKVPTVNEDDIIAHLKPAQLDSLVMKKDAGGSSLYPLLKALMFQENPDYKYLQDCQHDDTIQTPYGNKKVISAYTASPESDASGSAGAVQWGPTYAYVHGPANSAYPGPVPSGWHTVRAVTYDMTTAPVPPLVTTRVTDGYRYQALTGQNTQTGPTNATIKPEYQAEIDRMLQDPDYVPEFTDANTGQMHVPPANALTDAQIKEANAYVQAQQAAAQAAETAEILANEANQSRYDAEYARNKATEARNAANSNPSDPSLDTLADGLERDASLAESKARQAAGAASGAASTASSAASDAAQAPGGTMVGAPGGEYPGSGGGTGGGTGAGGGEDDVAASVPDNAERKTLDFAPLASLKGALANTYPFNLPSSLKGYYEKLKATGTAPQFQLPIMGQMIDVDLSVFNPVASVVRFLFGLLATSGLLYYIIHFFRGIS